MRILVCNDDSVHAHGIHALVKALHRLGEVITVAPLEEKSTTGHSLTLHKPLRILKMSENMYGVSGSPADCIHIGVSEIFKNKKPDLVVSGINRGANLGQDVYYSGTVSAAREAAMMGIPSFAVSLAIDFKRPPPEKDQNYEAAAKTAVKVIQFFQKNKKDLVVPPQTIININVPDLPYKKLKGITFARQGFRHYSSKILKRRDHRGRDYFWVGGEYLGFRKEVGTDCDVVNSGYAAITPLTLDTTHHALLASCLEHVDGQVSLK